MTQREWTFRQLGTDLDRLCCLDVRGYGISHLLDVAARSDAPRTADAAAALFQTLSPEDTVFLLTGFVLFPWETAETDGVIGTLFLARALHFARGAVPVVVCPAQAADAVRALAAEMGLAACLKAEVFPSSPDAADQRGQALAALYRPRAVVSAETPGANENGVYHNAAGLDVSAAQARSDRLFAALQRQGVLNIAVGDLGNETGMGALRPALFAHDPALRPFRCACPCKGEILAATAADRVIPATVSDWGCYALCAALAFLAGDLSLLPTPQAQASALLTSVRHGLIDMNGDAAPRIDGLDATVHGRLLALMRTLTEQLFLHETRCERQFRAML